MVTLFLMKILLHTSKLSYTYTIVNHIKTKQTVNLLINNWGVHLQLTILEEFRIRGTDLKERTVK